MSSQIKSPHPLEPLHKYAVGDLLVLDIKDLPNVIKIECVDTVRMQYTYSFVGCSNIVYRLRIFSMDSSVGIRPANEIERLLYSDK